MVRFLITTLRISTLHFIPPEIFLARVRDFEVIASRVWIRFGLRGQFKITQLSKPNLTKMFKT